MLGLLTQRICKGMMTPAKYKLLKELTGKGDVQKCAQIINIQFEELFEKEKPVMQIFQHFGLKSAVDFRFRNYGAVEMNIANQVKILDTIIEQRQGVEEQNRKSNQNQKESQVQKAQFYSMIRSTLHGLHSQLMLVYLLSDAEKLKKYLEKRELAIVPEIKHQMLALGSEFNYKIIRAICNICMGNVEKATNDLQMPLNSKVSNLHQNSHKVNQIRVKDMKKLIRSCSDKTIKVSTQDFKDVDIEYCLNTWISFRINMPAEYSDHGLSEQWFSVVYYMAENKFLKGDHTGSMKDMDLICESKEFGYAPLRDFLKMSSIYDQGRYEELAEIIERKMNDQKEQEYDPHWDKVILDRYSLLKKTFKAIKERSIEAKMKQTKVKDVKKEQAEEETIQDKIQGIQEAIQVMKEQDKIETEIKLPWYYFPSFFQVMFKWPALPTQKTSSSQQIAGRRGRKR